MVPAAGDSSTGRKRLRRAAVLIAAAGVLILVRARYMAEPPPRPGEVRADDPGLLFSPWVWCGDGSARQTTHFGASIRFGWTGRNLGLYVDVSMWDRDGAPHDSYPEIGYAIDDGPFGVLRLAPGQTSCTLAAGLPEGTHRAFVYLRRMAFDRERWRWGRQVALWRVTGLALDPGARIVPWPYPRPRRALFFGDSIVSGAFNLGAETDAYRSWAEVAAAELGAEAGRVGFEGQSYAIAGNPANGNVPALYVPGDRGGSTWDRLDSRHSRLAAGRFDPLPDLVFLCHGANDAIARVPGARVRASVEGLLPEVRRASGEAASIVVVVPFEGFHREAIRGAFDAYQAVARDPRCYLLDLGDDARTSTDDVQDGQRVKRSYDGLHPTVAMHERLGRLAASALRRLNGR